MDTKLLKKIVEGALLAAAQPLTVAKIASLFDPREEGELELVSESDDKPSKDEIQAALEDIQADCKGRGFELKEVGSGWRFQVIQDTAPWISRLWEEKPQKYSRALLETLALIAYRQPITRGEIESIRGVAVSSHIIKTLTEREWVKVVGHRDVPGRPALYATTKQFLDYFNLRSLDELPSLKEIREIDKIESELDFGSQQSEKGEASLGDITAALNGATDSASEDDASEAEQAVDESEMGAGAATDVSIASDDAEPDSILGSENIDFGDQVDAEVDAAFELDAGDDVVSESEGDDAEAEADTDTENGDDALALAEKSS